MHFNNCPQLYNHVTIQVSITPKGSYTSSQLIPNISLLPIKSEATNDMLSVTVEQTSFQELHINKIMYSCFNS